MLSDPRCPECGRAFDPDDPGSFNATPGEPGLITSSLAANISIYLAIGAVFALGAVWFVCWQEDRMDYVIWWMQNPQHRGNHGPWRRWGFAGAACNLSSILMLGALIFAWSSMAGKRSLKTVLVAILIPVLMFLLFYTHVLLVD